MTPGEQRTFQARMDCLPVATGFVEAFCELHGIARDDALRLTLIVEELFTNTITHGHGGDSDAPVRIELGVTVAHLSLRYEDNAPPFDPLQRLDAAPPDLDADVDDRAVGGLGIHLMARLAHSVDYAHIEGFNRLQLVLRRAT
jgi:serine/threonine-protein kinase RsbW